MMNELRCCSPIVLRLAAAGCSLLVLWAGTPSNFVAGQDKAAKIEKPKAEAAEPEEKVDFATKKWKELPVDEEQKKAGSAVGTKVLRAEKFGSDADRQALTDYYAKYALARWSQTQNLRELPTLRGTLRNHFRTAKGGPVYDYLNGLVLGFMEKKLIRDPDIHPVVRVNAALTISDLNAAEPARPAEPADPLPEALPVLVGIVNDANQLDAVKVAAMVGVIRQASFGVRDPAVRGPLTAAMLKVVEAPAPVGRAAAGNAWLRAQAAKALGLLGSAGNDGAVAKALGAVLLGGRNPMSCRCAAATALGQLDYATVGESLSASKLAAALGQLAFDAMAAESPPIVRARLRTRLLAVAAGLGGDSEKKKGMLGLAAAEPQQSYVGKVLKLVKASLDLLDKSMDDSQLSDKLQAAQKELESLVKTPP